MTALDEIFDTTAGIGEIATTFEDFTNNLLAGVMDTLVKSGLDQMTAYAELVSALSEGLEGYTTRMTGLDLSTDHIQEPNKALLNSYIVDVLGLDPTSTNTSIAGNEMSLTAHFEGVVVKGTGGETDTFDQLINEADSTINTIKLRELVYAKLKMVTKSNFDVLLTVVREGWIKILPDEWEVRTDLEINLQGNDFNSTVNHEYNRRASGWSIGGSVSGNFKVWGFRVGGGYSKSSLNVTTKRSVTQAQIDSDIKFEGHVRISGTATTYAPRELAAV